MSKLDEYLLGEFADFDRERQDIDRLIEQTLKSLEDLFVPERGWPYEISLSTPATANVDIARVSTSTIAMIAASLGAAIGRGSGGVLARHVDWQPERRQRKPQDNEKTLTTIRKCFDLLCHLASETMKNREARWIFESSTFGTDDVFTLSWLFDCYSALVALKPPPLDPDKLERTQTAREKKRATAEAEAEKTAQTDSTTLAKILHRVIEFREELTAALPSVDLLFRIQVDKGTRGEASEHAFPLLRLLQMKLWGHGRAERNELTTELKRLADMQPAAWQMEFTKRVHEQISFYSIPDSRFDPAELAFALEGLTLARPSAIDRAVLRRAFEVLTGEQKRNPTLRPTRPVRSQPAGTALFPVSVEIFNSLLRVGAIAVEQFGASLLQAHLVGLCRRYYSWLRPRLVDGRPDRPEVFGWHSEHINNPALVHPWETSQVLNFLLGYRTLVDQHLAAGSVTAAGLSKRPAAQRRSSNDAIAGWAAIAGRKEPVDGNWVQKGGPDLAVYTAIGRDFIDGHARQTPTNWSMILYGPPGTGKTGIAEDLADALGYPLITVTVSDFLAEGGLQIEAGAKAVFSVLTTQKRTVIIFDEIDHLLLDRNSDQYRLVDSSIQLMVPGMLTKVKDLRAAQRSIFLIATNYEERIDGAIKRAGRVDRKYLVMPPDRERRKAIIESILSDFSRDVRVLPAAVQSAAVQQETLLRSTARMSYPEIKAILLDVLARADDDAKLVSLLDTYEYPEPVADIDGYKNRKPMTKLLKEELETLKRIDQESADTPNNEAKRRRAGGGTKKAGKKRGAER